MRGALFCIFEEVRLMGKLLRDVKNFLVQQVLNKDDLAEVGKAYMATKGIDIRDGDESLTIVVHKRSREKSSKDAE